MNVLKGDLIQFALAGRFDVIIHGCNCFCTMGAGIAKLIRDNFVEAYQADLATQTGDRKKLGTYSSAHIKRNGNIFTIVNGYTQYDFSGHGTLADYRAIQKLFFRIKKEFSNQRIGYPKIGAGLAKGNWEVISGIINAELQGENHTLVAYVKI
ncbi:MAG: macro domain-containing protein [Deltaproteobacteria bacterium]|nr:macro domain-containing protein [Candidatus Desulfobacula maris]MBL6996188.1 macro domain-containing protein [Desulfobacula sp.]